MSRKWLFVIFAAVLLIAIAFFYTYPKKPATSQVKISNFKDCASAGYPVLQSYPRECRTPEGKSFFEIVAEPRP